MGNSCVIEEKRNNIQLDFSQAQGESKFFENDGNIRVVMPTNQRVVQKSQPRNKERTSIFESSFDPNDNGTPEPKQNIAILCPNMNEISKDAKRVLVTLDPLLEEPLGKKELGPYRYNDTKDTYRGHYRNGQRHGLGTLTSKKGDYFFGEFSHDKKNGLGRLIFSNGDLYEGPFKNNILTGKGKFYEATTDIKYEGDLENFYLHGTGAEYYPDGAVYEGDFFKNKKHGKGKLTLPDGEVYEGDFRDNQIEGHGILSNFLIFRQVLFL